MKQNHFNLYLFYKEVSFSCEAIAAGVDGIVVDWENVGKRKRQKSADTEVNFHTLDDLIRIRANTAMKVICRINSFGEMTEREVAQAVEAGADEILLPMVRSVQEVVKVIEWAGERCDVGILVETMEAVDLADELAILPLSRVYVGLNDLGIERRTPNIFTALVDGTLENIRWKFNIPFGLAGLTLPECGKPIPCRLLIGEMARIKADYTFLRRSFYSDMNGRKLADAIPRIRKAVREAWDRSEDEIIRNHKELERAVSLWQ